MTAEKPERRTRVRGGTAVDNSCTRQSLPACDENTEHSITATMEEVLSRSNMLQAFNRVVGNKGAADVDGMMVDQLWSYCQQHWERHREELFSGTYRPSPVRKVEIPKPGGKVMLACYPKTDPEVLKVYRQDRQEDFDDEKATSAFS